MEAPEAPYTPIAEIPGLVAAARATFESGRTRDLAWRKAQLDGVIRMIRENMDAIHAALAADVGKPDVEAYTAETSFSINDAELVKKKLDGWVRPQRVRTPIISQPGSSYVQREPLGVVLIIAPWNYPFQLAVAPLIGALAAGNTAVVKPSEVSPATSAILARLLPRYVDQDAVKVVLGGVPETTRLLEERFDHIFYTGNGAVGRIIMAAAAKHLTPVTLELGGKSPCIVDSEVELDVAVKRIALGKFYNCGQTCVAPDYVLAHKDVYEAFLTKLQAALREFFGPDAAKSPDYGRVVNARHHKRLMALLQGEKIVCGGEGDEAARYIAPTVLRDVEPDAAVMQEEIFGPILPVLKVESVDEAIRFINRRDKPLALYVFSTRRAVQEQVLAETSSGGATVNHVWMHLAVPGLPFGGVGPSGMGAYHGRHSFECFSHRKAVLRKPAGMDPPILYPPYDDTKKKWIKRIL
ncbi:MAG: aldehyde dehydrogenase family protein [Deltaproteobacteria bacterium]|nr:aldehyde dehydrogenase family protein [Deltaproteobacteria bacterium]